MGCSTSKGVVVDTNKPAIQEFNTGDLDDIAVNLDDVDQSTHKKKKNVPAVVTNENKVEPLSDKEFLAELRIRARTEDFSATLLEKYRDLIKQEALRDSVVAVGSFDKQNLQSKQGFVELLTQHGVTVSEKVMTKIMVVYSSRLLLCVDYKEAISLYKEVEALPQTTTLNLLAKRSVFLDGVFFVNTKTTIINALDCGVPKMYKIPKTEFDVLHEVDVWKGLKKFNEELALKHFIPLEAVIMDKGKLLTTFIRGEDEHQFIRFGILMPKYANVVSHFKGVDSVTIAKWMVETVAALNVMHQAGYTHGDVKPDNIFLDASGTVFLGDYGGSVLCNTLWRELSVAYMPSDVGTIALEIIDFYCLGLSAAELFNLWTPGTAKTKTEIRHMVENFPIDIRAAFVGNLL